MQVPLIPSLFIATILACIFPLVVIGRGFKSHGIWFSIGFGALGWTSAFLLRLPLLMFIQGIGEPLLSLILPAVLAGIFEETMRYTLARKFSVLVSSKECLLGYGASWGLGEIIVLYGLTIFNYSVAQINSIIPFASIFPGVIERYIAVTVHILMTIFIAASIKQRKYLYVAIGWHTIIDASIGVSLILLGSSLNVWMLEMIFASITLLIASYALPLWKKLAKHSSSNDVRGVNA